MGDVYRARDHQLRRDVAVKVLPGHMSLDPDARSRLGREARAVAALSHHSILAIHGFGQEGTASYAVMELLVASQRGLEFRFTVVDGKASVAF